MRCNAPDAPVATGFVAFRLATGPIDESQISPGDLAPVDPTRLLDTRDGGGPIGPNGQRDLDVTTGPVPTTDVLSVVLNVTAVEPTQAGYLTVYPAGTSPRPTASNLNFRRRPDRAQPGHRAGRGQR